MLPYILQIASNTRSDNIQQELSTKRNSVFLLEKKSILCDLSQSKEGNIFVDVGDVKLEEKHSAFFAEITSTLVEKDIYESQNSIEHKIDRRSCQDYTTQHIISSLDNHTSTETDVPLLGQKLSKLSNCRR